MTPISKPKPEDFNLTEQRYKWAKKLMSFWNSEGPVYVLCSMGILIGVLWAFLNVFQNLAELSVGVVFTYAVFILLSGLVGAIGISFALASILLWLFVVLDNIGVMNFADKALRVSSTRQYDRATTSYDRIKIVSGFTRAQNKSATREAISQEIVPPHLQDDIDWHLYLSIPERHRHIENGVLRITGEYLMTIVDWRQFELILEYIFQEHGWNTTLKSKGKNQGVDVIGTKSVLGDNRKLFVHAKHYGDIDLREIRKLISAAVAADCTEAIIVSSSGFTDEARAFVKDYQSSPKQFQFNLDIIWGTREIQDLIDGLNPSTYASMLVAIKRDLVHIV